MLFEQRLITAKNRLLLERRNRLDVWDEEEEEEEGEEEEEEKYDVIDIDFVEDEQKKSKLPPQGPPSAPADVPLRYELALYPTFARSLNMRVVECSEDCCVSIM